MSLVFFCTAEMIQKRPPEGGILMKFCFSSDTEKLNHLDLWPTAGSAQSWALLLSAQLSSQHLLVYGSLVGQPGKHWVVGLPEIFFLASSVHDGELVSKLTISLMMDTLCSWISLRSCDLKDAIVLAVISAIPSASGLVSFLRTWKHSSSDIFCCSNSDPILQYFILLILSISGAQKVRDVL